jgi:hypothetical protein
MTNGMSALYLIAFSPNLIQGLMGDTMEWDMLKFYGSLIPPQKAALQQGGKVPFSQLSQQARSILTEMAFNGRANIKTTAKMKEESVLPFFLTMWMDMSGKDATTYAEEPTELMPTGLPPAGWVELAQSNETVVNSDSNNSIFLGFGGMGAGELAMIEMMAEYSEGEGSQFFTLPDRVKIGSRDRLKFSFWLSPEAGMTKTLLDDKFEKNAQPISFANIPTSLRAEIDKKKKEIKDSPYGRFLGGIGYSR